MDYENFLKNNVDNTVELLLEKNIYNKKTVFRTCYKFTDVVYIYIKTTENSFIVYFTHKKDDTSLSDVVHQFTNELLDQELRQIILEDTQKIRDTIVTRALLSGQSHAV